jgi:phosphatidylserine/phosphatidylglycerophosphate/cardiolipin synthase-like enzyme
LIPYTYHFFLSKALVFQIWPSTERIDQDLKRFGPQPDLDAEALRTGLFWWPPRYNGNIPEELGRQALKSLEAIGAAVDLRSRIHEKVVLIDDHIAWFGSLNPLSHTAHTTEIMARVENEEVVDSYSKNVGRSPPLAARSQSCWRGACRKSAL